MKIVLYTAMHPAPSLCHGQVPPISFQYVRAEDSLEGDLALATADSARELLDMEARHGQTRPRVLWCQETSFLTPDVRHMAASFNLVLTNQAALMHLPNARYMTLVGTWLRDRDIPPKTERVSMISSGRNVGMPGHNLRIVVARHLPPWVKRYGGQWGNTARIAHKEQGLHPFMFSIAIENESYRFWHTEKLFDCFAAKTIPIYWGCEDDFGILMMEFDSLGIWHFQSRAELEHLLAVADEEHYENLRESVERNYRRAWELYCPEVLLEPMLQELLVPA